MNRFLACILLVCVGCADNVVGPGAEVVADTGSMDAMPDAAEPDVARNGPTCDDGPGAVFDERIRPLLEVDRPSSCSKCHAAGVNLAAFVTGDACSSMACLIAMDLVNLDDVYDSKLLTFIERGYEPEPNTGVTDVLVAREYNGIRQWIEWTAACPDACDLQDTSSCPAPQTPLIGEEPPPEEVVLPPLDIEGYPCDWESQLAAFRDYVFPPQSRCGHCHAENGAIAGVADAPVWLDAHKTVDGSARTVQRLIALGAFDFDNPQKSRFLLKPLAEAAGGIDHGGGSKFVDREDQLYVDALQWIRMQRECSLTRSVELDLTWTEAQRFDVP